MQLNEKQLQHARNQLVPCDVSAGRKSEKPIVCFNIIRLINETWVLVISLFHCWLEHKIRKRVPDLVLDEVFSFFLKFGFSTEKQMNDTWINLATFRFMPARDVMKMVKGSSLAWLRTASVLWKIRNLNNFISLYKIYFEVSYKHIEKAPHTLHQPNQFSHSVSLLTSGNWTAKIVKCSHTWRAWLLAFFLFPLPSANKATPQFPCVLQTGIYF